MKDIAKKPAAMKGQILYFPQDPDRMESLKAAPDQQIPIPPPYPPYYMPYPQQMPPDEANLPPQVQIVYYPVYYPAPGQAPVYPTPPPEPAKPETKPTPKSAVAKLIHVISNLLSVFLILLAVLMVYSFVTGDREYGVALGPFKMFNVLTGSMEPAISQGSMIVTTEPDEYELKRGDVVTFVLTGDSSNLVTHRITKVGPDPHTFTTRGDSNRVDDPPIQFDNIIGKHVLTIPFLGLVVSSLSSPLSAVWLVSIAMLFMLLFWIVKKIFQEDKKDGGAPA